MIVIAFNILSCSVLIFLLCLFCFYQCSSVPVKRILVGADDFLFYPVDIRFKRTWSFKGFILTHIVSWERANLAMMQRMELFFLNIWITPVKNKLMSFFLSSKWLYCINQRANMNSLILGDKGINGFEVIKKNYFFIHYLIAYRATSTIAYQLICTDHSSKIESKPQNFYLLIFSDRIPRNLFLLIFYLAVIVVTIANKSFVMNLIKLNFW